MPLSKIVRDEQESAADIQPFPMREVIPTLPHQDAPVSAPPKIIRDGETSSFAIRPFSLFDSPSSPVLVRQADFANPAGGVPEAQIRPWSEDQGPAPSTEEHSTQADEAAHLEHEAVRIRQQAQEEAERCVAEAQEKAAAVQAEAYAEGFRQGAEAAGEEATQQFAAVLACFQQATEEISCLRTTVLRQAEEDVVTLAFQLARKIVPQEVLCKREVLANTLQRALDHLVDWEKVVVRVNPADLEQALALQKTLLYAATGAGKNLTIKGDGTIGRGGCVVESAFGDIDARIETQLEEMEQRFRERFNPPSETEAP